MKILHSKLVPALLLGRDKRAYIVALQQAELYPPRRAATAADRALWLPQCTSCNARDEVCVLLATLFHLMHCGLCIAAAPFKFVAAAIHEVE